MCVKCKTFIFSFFNTLYLQFIIIRSDCTQKIYRNSLFIFFYLFIWLSVCLFILFFIYLSVCLCICFNIYLSVRLFNCLFICLSVSLFVCLSVCLFICGGEAERELNPKRHIWERLLPDLCIDERGVATYRGVAFEVRGKGLCRAPTINNGGIK